MTAARTSLVEQKRLQWAKEREEIARLMGNRNSYPPDNRSYGNGTRGSFSSESIGNGPLLPLRCCSNDPHLRHLQLESSLDDPRRYRSRCASTTSLRSLANSDLSFASLRDLDRCGAMIGNNDANHGPAMTMMSDSCCSARSLLDLGHNDDDDRRRHRLGYLPPIYKDELRCQQQKQEYEQSQERRMQQSRSSQHRCSRNARHRSSAASNATSTVVTSDQKKKTSSQTQATTRTSGEEDREEETSGYASDNNNYDSLRLQQQQQIQDHVLPRHVNQSSSMSEKTWRNPYCNADENVRPPSRNLPTYRSSGGGGEFNRQRWGSVWGQDVSKDPPPPSWLERGLSRLDHNSQVLVITHDSASSPSSDGGQSSTGSSYGSSSSEAGGARSTYLRGQNEPIDAAVLQERESKRRKALELQRAIKRQLEDRERSRKQERENELREQRAEEERLRRQQSLEKQRIEEEKRLQREREAAKLKKSKAMQEVLEAAERRAKEDKQLSRRRKQQQEDGPSNDDNNKTSGKSSSRSVTDNNKEERVDVEDKSAADKQTSSGANESSSVTSAAVSLDSTRDNGVTKKAEESQQQQQSIDLPVSQEVTIVLSGRIDDPELLLRNAPLKLVNLVLNANSINNNSPRGSSPRSSIGSTAGLGALLQGLSQAGQVILHAPPLSPRAGAAGGANNCTTPRLLTPSKYRMAHRRRRGAGGGGGRECGTQTDCEADPSSTDYGIKEEEDEDEEREDRKDATSAARRELEKSTSTTGNEDSIAAASKSFPSRAKAQKRTSLESRPRWNANRPGTRYRTQSEKDPHYQRRMRLMTRRSRRIETSDEGCSSDFYRRSPSPVVASRRPAREQRRQQQHSGGVANNDTIVKAKLSRNSVIARRSGDEPRSDVRRNAADYNDNENDNVDDDYSMDSLTSLVPLQTDKNGRINIQRLDDVDSSSYDNNTNDRNVWCGAAGGSDLLSHLTSLRNGLMAKKKEWDLQECPVTPLTELY
uniref:CCDC66 domain-containing protein n=1 Tax=Trichogramma kaykai TaxID=54128 RepID=A0ABD2WMR9_9HYME